MKISHPLSVSQFLELRSEIWNFALEVQKTSNKYNNIIIEAPVKSGKKEQVFAQALLDQNDKTIKHVYVTSFYRKENENQLEQYSAYNIEVLKTNTNNFVNKSIDKIKIYFKKYKKVVIHIDESDYGTDKNGLLNKLFEILIHNENCQMRFYSATNEEAKNSRFAKNFNTAILKFKPPINYNGAAWFLDNNLVKDAEPFFEIDENNNINLTKQSQEIIEQFKNSNKPIGVVRIVGKNNEKDDTNFKIIKNSSQINRYFAKIGIKCEYVDSNNDFDWETKPENYNDLFESTRLKHLIILNQKTVRSTEIYCHNLIDFWHDYRKLDTTYATSQQAILRVCHYGDLNKNVNTKINVFSDINIFKKACDRMTEEEFTVIAQRELSSRIKSFVIKKKYKLYDKIDDIPVIYRNYYDKSNAQAHCSANNKNDLADIVLKHTSHTYKIIYLDSENSNHKDSWNNLINEYPEILQGYKYAVFEECASLVENVSVSTSKESMYSYH